VSSEHDLYGGRPEYPSGRKVERIPILNVALFVLTFLTTAMASAINQGADFISHPTALAVGLPFAVTMMAILLFHECGHYFLAASHRVEASLPYFIPAPPIFPLGTFGAFIRMRGMTPNRAALFDIGAAGPWAGFVVAVSAVVFGLQLSSVGPLEPPRPGQGVMLIFGDSLLFSWLTHLILGVSSSEVTVYLHPVALAGWFGLFITAMNLLPAGQLDGGHVAYAVFGRYHRWISRGVLVFLVVLGVFGDWLGWLLFAGLVWFLGVDHPPPRDPYTPLEPRRVLAAVITLGVLILTFMPTPVSLVEAPPPVPRFQGERTPVSAPRPAPHGFVFQL